MAAFGALAFGFSTYLIIILGVGHNSKAHAIAYMPLVLAGIIWTFQEALSYRLFLDGNCVRSRTGDQSPANDLLSFYFNLNLRESPTWFKLLNQMNYPPFSRHQVFFL